MKLVPGAGQVQWSGVIVSCPSGGLCGECECGVLLAGRPWWRHVLRNDPARKAPDLLAPSRGSSTIERGRSGLHASSFASNATFSKGNRTRRAGARGRFASEAEFSKGYRHFASVITLAKCGTAVKAWYCSENRAAVRDSPADPPTRIAVSL